MSLAERLARPVAWWGAIALILGLAAVVAAAGTATLPLEGHEALVVQTAQEMHQRGDYIVPYFNGEPRLVKPPLSYWLTAATAWLSGDPAHILPWQGRLPSILAGLGLVGLAITLGRICYDRATALAAGLVLAASAGFFAYTHNARPDLLYAFWCAAGYTAFALAWRSVPGGLGERGWAYAMWAAYGLATLTKGPQLPLMLILGSALYAGLCDLGWRHTARVLRPAAGLLILAALTLPWWLWLRHRLGGNGLSGSQLQGSLLIPDWRAILHPYYLYRPLQLVLPWALLAVPAALLVRRSGRDSAAAWLACLILVPALLLSFGVQRRWFYMLPVLPALAVLLAAAGARWLGEPRPGRDWRSGFFAFHGLLIVAALSWLLGTGERPPATGPGPIVLALALDLPLLMWLVARRGRAPWLSDLAVVAVMTAVVFIALGDTRFLWSRDRYERERLARAAVRGAGPDTPLLSLGINPNVYVYYTGRRITWVRTIEGLKQALAAQGEARVILASRELDSLSECCELAVLDSMPGGRDESVVRLRLRGSAARPAPG
jgi:4-amino-4-deoxy-L-arabinose transferase-like glycosyltransferase